MPLPLITLLLAVAQAVGLRRHTLPKSNVDYRVSLANSNNVQYSGAFVAGRQSLPVVYDTGSFEILVLSTLCSTCSNGHVIYDQRKSDSFVSSQGAVTEHLFGSGPVYSEKGFETVSLGGPDSPYAVQRMPFYQVVSHEIDVWYASNHFSGIVGLGHPSFIPEGYSAKSKDAADETLLSLLGIGTFAICLERSAPGAPGWLAVGPTVEAYAATATPSFQSLTVVGKVHWGLRMTGLSADGVDGDLCQPSCGAIIDSGTSLIAAPPSAAAFIEALSLKIPRDCSNLHTLPVLRLVLDGKTLELPPAAYVMQVREANSSALNGLFKDSEREVRTTCRVAFMSMDKMSQFGPVWILGMPFLRYYYTVFDRSGGKIHVARASPSCEPQPQVPLAAMALGSTVSRPVNSSSFSALSAGLRTEATATAFADRDYQAIEVDLAGARLPTWAGSSSQGTSKELVV